MCNKKAGYMKVLMVGVDENRIGGMWTVSKTYIESKKYNREIKLYYVATSTCGSICKRIVKMLRGFVKVLVILIFCNVDIVHIHMAEKGSVYRGGIVTNLSKLFRKKVIIHMHAGPIMAWIDTLSERKKCLVKKILNKPDMVLVLGDFWKTQLESIIDSKKLNVLYNGIEVPERRNYNNNGKVILYTGLLKEEKGIFDLLDAICIIEKSIPDDMLFYLCGKDMTGRVKKYIEDKGISHRIVLTGWISNEKIEGLFANTKICILPSYYEALSMSVLEAMSYGIPMITTNISTMPELLGENIELVEPGDVNQLAKYIIRLIQNCEECERMSVIEYNRAKELFSKEQFIDNTLKSYLKLG